MTNVYDLNIIDKNDKVTPLQKGHSKAKKWKVCRGKNKFFLKSFPKCHCAYSVKDVYDDINAKVEILPKVIDEQVKGEEKFVLFEFVDSINFNKKSLKQVESLAKQTAFALKMMSLVEVNVPQKGLKELEESCLKDIDFYFEHRTCPYNLSKQEVEELVKKYIKSFEKEKQILIHGDVKPENIMQGEKGLLFVDTDDMQQSFFALNFQYSVQMFFCRSKKLATFMKSVVKSYFDNNIPLEFYDNLKFVCINKFFNRAKMFIETKDESGEEVFEKEFSKIFKSLKKDWSMLFAK